jgi:hypothetical protein
VIDSSVTMPETIAELRSALTKFASENTAS